MLFNSFLVNIIVLLWFSFLFLDVFNNFFMSPIEIENARLKPALPNQTDAPITVINDAIKILSLVAYKTIKDFLK